MGLRTHLLASSHVLACTLGNRHSRWQRMRVSSHYSGRKLPDTRPQGRVGCPGPWCSVHGGASKPQGYTRAAALRQERAGRALLGCPRTGLPSSGEDPILRGAGCLLHSHRTAFAKAKHHTLPSYPQHAACSPRSFHQRSGMHKGRCRPPSLTSQPGFHVLGQTLTFQPLEQFRCCQ